MGRFRANPIGKVEYKSFKGTITGLDYDNQSRPIIEVAFAVNGVEKILKHKQIRLNFEPQVGQEVLVEFIPTNSGILINVRV